MESNKPSNLTTAVVAKSYVKKRKKNINSQCTHNNIWCRCYDSFGFSVFRIADTRSAVNDICAPTILFRHIK